MTDQISASEPLDALARQEIARDREHRQQVVAILMNMLGLCDGAASLSRREADARAAHYLRGIRGSVERLLAMHGKPQP